MYDPEYYLQKCEIINRNSNTTYSKTGKYKDTIICKDDEEFDLENKNNISSERETFVVISTPAVNVWVEEIEKMRHEIKSGEKSSSSSAGIKRPLENEEEMETETTQNKKISTTRNTEVPKPSLSKEHYLNCPIPGEYRKACQVKVYESNSNIKLNEVYDFVGFLSTDVIAMQDNENCFDMEMEIQTHNPPASLIPRLHCVFWKKIEYENPLAENINLNVEKIKFLRKELHLILTEAMMGDELAANYLLYHLLSRVYLRRDLMPLGTFTLNISNIPVRAVEDYGNKLYDLLQMLLPKSHYLPMTLENMNDLTFTPKKDYNCNRLTSGLFQLSEGTHLVLDETKLSSGKLNESGVRAISAINNIIKVQKVAYDFNYHTMEFDCDIPILVLSEGKSLLPSDGQVILKPSKIHVNTFNEIYEAIMKLLNPDLLNDIRTYLTISKYGQYEISDNMLEIVENDFVRFRQTDNISADDLHQLLVLSRLICLSEGKSSLDEECWRSACDLENLRKLRL
ncbi:hypothetical protein MML48_1g03068 [Holotrichia oblita]|uniref:Uncharacterized protein n=1 Tax=Holotrichia oblita TaxID=644536 RepID=A0ACB9TTF8_HOLOL|nr:hypothetical protein MML48_1g03068 [Holotrichia oblita]